MARNPGPGKCIHCLRLVGARTWDHVLPKSWYPSTSSATLKKWQAPSCQQCNSELGRIEEDLFIRLAMSMQHHRPEFVEIVTRALRSIDPTKAKNPIDKLHRSARRDRLFRESLHGDAIPDGPEFPGFGERWGRPKSEQVAITVSPENLERFAEKIVRGVFYVQDEIFIDPPFKVDVHILDSKGIEVLSESLDQFGIVYSLDPCLRVSRALAVEDQRSSLLSILIFEQLHIHATVLRSETSFE